MDSGPINTKKLLISTVNGQDLGKKPRMAYFGNPYLISL